MENDKDLPLRKKQHQQGSLLKLFFSPLRQPRIVTRILVLSVLVSCLLTWLDVQAQKHIAGAAIETLFLAVEMNTESGPDFVGAKEVHAHLLQVYIERIEDRPFGRLFSMIRPSLSAKVRLEPALSILCRESSAQTSLNAIRKAGEILLAVGQEWSTSRDLSKFASSAPAQYRALVRKEIRQFQSSRQAFFNDPNRSTAEVACMDSRLASTTLLALWDELQGTQLVQDFTSSLRSLSNAMKTLSVESSDTGLLSHYANNVDRRAKFFESLENGDVKGGYEILLASTPDH